MENNLKVQIFATLQFEGTHAWPECPFEDVAFLRDQHRHIFWIQVFKKVNHLNRDTEFILLKRGVEKYLHLKFPKGELGSTSCEMIGKLLIETFNLEKAVVSEDNENGAVVERCN